MERKLNMFKHPSEPAGNTNNNIESKEVQEKTSEIPEKEKVDSLYLKDLLEKNLKWSQIIYEQNRKINNKLLWSAVANWIRLGLILVPFILALWFLPSIVRNFIDTYERFLNPGANTTTINNFEDFIKLLPLNAEQQLQLKAVMDKK